MFEFDNIRFIIWGELSMDSDAKWLKWDLKFWKKKEKNARIKEKEEVATGNVEDCKNQVHHL